MIGIPVAVLFMLATIAVGLGVYLLLTIGWRKAAWIAVGPAVLLPIAMIFFIGFQRSQVHPPFVEPPRLIQVSTPPPVIDLATAKAPENAPAANGLPAADRPAWVEQPGQRKGSVYEIAVKSGLFVTDAECQRGLEAAEREAVDDYLDNYLEAGASRSVRLDATFVHDHLQTSEYQETTTTSVGKMRQLHALLAFDDSARQMFRERWRQARVDRNLGYVAGGAGMAVALLAAAYGYLTITSRRVEVPRSSVPA